MSVVGCGAHCRRAIMYCIVLDQQTMMMLAPYAVFTVKLPLHVRLPPDTTALTNVPPLYAVSAGTALSENPCPEICNCAGLVTTFTVNAPLEADASGELTHCPVAT